LTGIPAGAVQMTVTLIGGGGMSGSNPVISQNGALYNISVFGGGGSGAIQQYFGIPVSSSSLIYYQYNTGSGGMGVTFFIGTTQIGTANGGSVSAAYYGPAGTILAGGFGGTTSSNGVYTPNNYVGTNGENGAVYQYSKTTTYNGPQTVQNTYQAQAIPAYANSVCTGGCYNNVIVTDDGGGPFFISWTQNDPKPAAIQFQIYCI
jgi:hypothetical protein